MILTLQNRKGCIGKTVFETKVDQKAIRELEAFGMELAALVGGSEKELMEAGNE